MGLPPKDLQQLLAEEPFVRALARSLIADEADDVVQQAWLRALEQRQPAVRNARAWLARLVQNLVVDLRRRRLRRSARESQAATHPLVPSSAELAMAEERRRALMAAVDALPEHLRSVVLLRWFEGMPPRHIAKELGVPASVVWNRLHAALAALRSHLDAEHGGDRRAWLVPLVPFAASPRELPWTELANPAGLVPLTTGVITMTSKLKSLSVVALFAVAALAWMTWPELVPQAPQSGAQSAAQRVTASLEQPKASELPARSEAPAGERVAAPAAPSRGSLEITVQYADEPKTGANVVVTALAVDGDLRVDSLRDATDAEGKVRFPDLRPGTYRVRAHGRSGQGAKLEVAPGKVTAGDLLLERGHRLDGVVVDGDGVPIRDAWIETLGGGTDEEEAQPVCTTGADGTFVLRQCHPYQLVGARAQGFAASQLYFVRGDDAPSSHLRIELRAMGGTVEGLVVDPDGKPIANAIVRIGEGQTDSIRSTNQGAPPLPAQVRSDAAGRFVAIGVPSGTQPILARGGEMAPWLGSVEVMPRATTMVRVTMQPGVVCRGLVQDEAGAPQGGAVVSVGKQGEFARCKTESAADGTFVLRGLPTGDLDVLATKDKVGKATARVRGEPGSDVPCKLVLSAGIVLRGRVVDEANQPLRGVQVRCTTDGSGKAWTRLAISDAEGRFAVEECPAGQALVVHAATTDRVEWERAGVDPQTGALEVVLPKDTSPRAQIVGRLLGPDGVAPIGTTIEAIQNRPRRNAAATIDDASGAFRIEVGQGLWAIRIQAKGFPDLRRDKKPLAAGETWDLGTLQLVAGGTLVVRDDPTVKLDYLVVDTADRFVCGLHSPVPPLRSELIAPGEYRLLVRGPGIAAHAMPFTIRAGQETTLQVRPEPGVMVQIEFLPPPGETPNEVAYAVQRGGQRVALGYTKDAATLIGTTCLAPGDYEIVTRERALVTTAMVSVQPGMALPVRVQLR